MRLETKELSKEFNGVPALSSVSLVVEPGSIHALCGENGAGKSTLLKILAGCWPVGTYGGAVELDGKIAGFANPRQAELAGVSLVAQELALVGPLSIAENICLRAEPEQGLFLDKAAMERTARVAMDKVGLKADPWTPCEQLGVGAQQLVEIARALSRHARLLILDEPTAALGEADALRLESLVRELAATGVTCLYVSHRLDEVFRIATHLTVLRDGRSIRSGAIQEWTRDSVVSAMVGRSVDEKGPRAESRARGAVPALEVKELTLAHPTLPGREALRSISLSVASGEILGLGGLMGSGRTALLSSLYGAALSPLRGSLVLEGTERAPFEDPRQALEAGVVLLSEDRKRLGLIPTFDVAENILLARLGLEKGPLGWLDHAQGRSQAQLSREKLRVKAASLDLPALSLSGGNQQKVLLARALLLSPKVLLLDEPTRGIDVGARAEIYELLRELASQGVAILFASSDLPELLQLADRILVLSQGRLTKELKPEAYSAEAVMHAATL